MTHASFMTTGRRVGTLLILAGALLLASGALAQDIKPDAPTAFEPMPKPADQLATRTTPTCKVTLEAVCWYLPNRIMDLVDIPRAYFTVGDGMGVSVRATKYIYASYFQDDAYCFGWTPRKPPVFGEKLEESYFGFIAAQEGEPDRDPTEVGVSIHGILGINLAISLGQLVDFFAGIGGVDLAGDDHGPVINDYTQPDPDTERVRDALYTPHEYTTEPYKSPSGEIGPPEQPARPAPPAGTAPAPTINISPVPMLIR